MKKLTPVLVVDRIEPCLAFWVDRLGFQKTVEVPHGDRLGFVILVHGAIELMLQTRASVQDDLPALANGEYRTCLYLEVADLETVKRAITGMPRTVEERVTFYGAREIGVVDPAGNPVIFAQQGT